MLHFLKHCIATVSCKLDIKTDINFILHFFSVFHIFSLSRFLSPLIYGLLLSPALLLSLPPFIPLSLSFCLSTYHFLSLSLLSAIFLSHLSSLLISVLFQSLVPPLPQPLLPFSFLLYPSPPLFLSSHHSFSSLRIHPFFSQTLFSSFAWWSGLTDKTLLKIVLVLIGLLPIYLGACMCVQQPCLKKTEKIKNLGRKRTKATIRMLLGNKYKTTFSFLLLNLYHNNDIFCR